MFVGEDREKKRFLQKITPRKVDSNNIQRDKNPKEGKGIWKNQQSRKYPKEEASREEKRKREQRKEERKRNPVVPRNEAASPKRQPPHQIPRGI